MDWNNENGKSLGNEIRKGDREVYEFRFENNIKNIGKVAMTDDEYEKMCILKEGERLEKEMTKKGMVFDWHKGEWIEKPKRKWFGERESNVEDIMSMDL